MRNPLSKTIVTIQPSGIRKFFDIVNEMEDAISLGVGEPDFDTPWHIRDEGIYSLEKGRTFYTSNAGLKELKIEIAKYLFRNYDLQYDYQHEIVVTVGGSEAIDIAMRAMLDPGDEVLIPQPSYVSYYPCCILANGTPVVIELKAENEFRLKPEELEKHNEHLQAKYAQIQAQETRWEGAMLEDAELVLVAYGITARIAYSAMEMARMSMPLSPRILAISASCPARFSRNTEI